MSEASPIGDHPWRLTLTEGRGQSTEGKLRGGTVYMGTLRGRVGVRQVEKGGRRQRMREEIVFQAEGTRCAKTWG